MLNNREEELKARAEKYHLVGSDIGDLVGQKQLAYGDSFGKAGEVLKQMYPEGIQPAQYKDLLTIVRILDKLFRIATDRDAFGENPFRDICGYALLSCVDDKKDDDNDIHP